MVYGFLFAFVSFVYSLVSGIYENAAYIAPVSHRKIFLGTIRRKIRESNKWKSAIRYNLPINFSKLSALAIFKSELQLGSSHFCMLLHSESHLSMMWVLSCIWSWVSTDGCDWLTGYFSEGIFLHFCASMISGLITTAASMPVDIAKTRIQNMKIIDGKPEYKGALVSRVSHYYYSVIFILKLKKFKSVKCLAANLVKIV